MTDNKAMQTGRFDIEVSDKNLTDIFQSISDDEITAPIRQICERWGDGEDDVRYYNVYKVETGSKIKLLKKTSPREAFVYEHYLCSDGLPVPKFFGSYTSGNDVWILTEYIYGNDLRNMTDALALAAADSLSQLQNKWWQNNEAEFVSKKTDDRFEIYFERISRRAAFVKSEIPRIKTAYDLFTERQLTCPRTLSNGDFLEFNAIHATDRVIIIDWGFSGIMPYSLDIARFVSHATENASTFPFYMSDAQKSLFTDRVYKNLIKKPDYERYLLDVRLSALNEYVEFIEADEDENRWYLEHALKLAESLV